MVTDKPTVISLFAGCGGSSLGYQMAGYKELLAVEWDKHAAATFRLNFPDVLVYENDIAKLSVTECLRLASIGKGKLDVLDSSPPCQGFSMAGKREFRDQRNQLGFEVVRLAEGLQPRVIIMENVASMVQGATRMLYLDIVKGFQKAGYKTKAAILNAMYFGVPQHRRRLILIGVRKDLEIEPNHPKPKTKPIAMKEILENGTKEHLPKFNDLYADCYARLTEGQNASHVLSKGFNNCVRPRFKRPSPTLPKTQTGHGFATICHPSEPRGLSIGEAKRLQSFPDDFVFLGSYSEQWASIGNSVPPLMMKAIAEHVKTKILERAKLVTE